MSPKGLDGSKGLSPSPAARLNLFVMPMRTYKANRWLWCLASVVVFVGIGLLVQFDNKGVNAPLGLLVLGWVWALLTGAEPLRFLPMVAGWVALWFAVALVLGWLLQSLVVIAASKYEKKKPMA
jgi:hypothetical protein